MFGCAAGRASVSAIDHGINLDRRPSFGLIAVAGALAGPSFVTPMALWASNAGRFVDPVAVLAAGLIVLVVASGLLRLARASELSHLVAGQMAVLAFWAWDVVPTDWLPSAGSEVVAGLAAVVVAAWAGSRLRSFAWLASVIAFALGAASMAMAVTGFSGDSVTSPLPNPPVPQGVEFGESDRDLLILILDAYTSPFVLKSEYDHDISSTVEALEQAGFEVPGRPFSNYPATLQSVPSVLSLDYLPVDAAERGDGSAEYARRLVGGDAGLLAWASESGYTTTKFQSAWEDDRCGSVDVCFGNSSATGPTAWILWRRTPFRRLASEWMMHPYPNNTVSVLEQLPEEIERAMDSENRDVIIAHVISPHAPYRLSSDCVPKLSRATDYGSEEGYVGQVDCLNTHLVRLARQVDGSDMAVLIFGDHGSDLRREDVRGSDVWSDDDIAEALGVFVAVRVPSGCGSLPQTLVNIARHFVACAVGGELPLLEDRHFIGGSDLVEVTERVEAMQP